LHDHTTKKKKKSAPRGKKENTIRERQKTKAEKGKSKKLKDGEAGGIPRATRKNGKKGVQKDWYANCGQMQETETRRSKEKKKVKEEEKDAWWVWWERK